MIKWHKFVLQTESIYAQIIISLLFSFFLILGFSFLYDLYLMLENILKSALDEMVIPIAFLKMISFLLAQVYELKRFKTAAA